MKRPPILTPDILNEQNKKALRNGPNISGKRKLLQLERLHKLHVLYEKAKLESVFYLLLSTCDRKSTTETTEFDGQQACDERS